VTDLPPGAVALLACPVCGAGLSAAAAGVRCAAGHAFDRARQGHVTLLPPGHLGQPLAERAVVVVAVHGEQRPAALPELVEQRHVDPVAGVHDDVRGLDRRPQGMR
jgi:23S rRNA (guanine745-N1)-methyltransferase